MGELGLGDGETRVDAPTDGWTDALTVETDDDGRPVIVVSADAPFGPSEVTVRRGSGVPERESVLAGSYWLLLAPGVAVLVAAVLVAAGVVASGAPGGRSPVLVGLALLAVVLAGAADRWIYDDAAHLAAVDAAWQPDPRRYFVGGGAVVVLGLAFLTGEPAVLLSDVRAVAGLVVVGLVLSSAVSGPLYLYNRYRTVGLR